MATADVRGRVRVRIRFDRVRLHDRDEFRLGFGSSSLMLLPPVVMMDAEEIDLHARYWLFVPDLPVEPG